MKTTFYAVNGYRIMWLFVFFDLPTKTKKDKKAYTGFRKRLQQNGFQMMQYSVYIRHCASRESLAVHAQRVKKNMPAKGHVSLLPVTDKQYGQIMNYWGKGQEPLAPAPPQLELF